MEQFYSLVDQVSAAIWGGPMILLLLGTGLYFMIRLRLRPLRRLFPAFGELWAGRKGGGGAGDSDLSGRPGRRVLDVDHGACRHGGGVR